MLFRNQPGNLGKVTVQAGTFNCFCKYGDDFDHGMTWWAGGGGWFAV
jgi:hypothetical protein